MAPVSRTLARGSRTSDDHGHPGRRRWAFSTEFTCVQPRERPAEPAHPFLDGVRRVDATVEAQVGQLALRGNEHRPPEQTSHPLPPPEEAAIPQTDRLAT